MSNYRGKISVTRISQKPSSEDAGPVQERKDVVRPTDESIGSKLHKAFPRAGRPWLALKSCMEEMRSDDFEWQRGRLPLHVYFAGNDVAEVVREAYAMFMAENALAPAAFPSLERMEREVLDASVELFNGPAGAGGTFTSGGSESIILAVKAAREWARARRLREGVRGEILLPSTAHPAFDKAAELMDLDAVRIEIGRDFRANVTALETAITDRTVLIVASAPSLPFGLIDPVEEIAALALEYGIWCHVDACIGGYIAPFARKLGYPVPRFDFTISGVRSISADLHKFGYAAKGASALLLRNRADAAFHAFEFANWPKGKYITPNLLGTRPGGAIAAAWAVIHYLGEDGYLELTARVMKVRDRYIEGIAAIPDLKLLVQPDLSVIAYGSDVVDIAAVGDQLLERGWYMSRIAQPPSLHQTITLAQEAVVDDFLAELANAVDQVQRHSIVAKSAEVLTY